MNPFDAVDDPEVRARMARLWWLMLVMGIVWVLIALVVLSFSPTSVATVGYLVGAVLLLAGVSELVDATVAPAWRWVHAVLGVLFLVAGVLALLEPFQTFGILALFIGWYLVVRGTFEVVVSLVGRHELSLWGLLLASGLIEIAIGIWAIGSPVRSAWLLVIWVGIGAAVRGIAEIIASTRMRGDRAQLATA